MSKLLTLEEIIIIHDMVIEEMGGLPGIRDKNLLESAVEGVYQVVFGVDLYPNDIIKAARMGYNVIAGHVFTDGNKRTGCYIIIYSLKALGYKINEHKTEMADEFILKVAEGKIRFDEFAKYVDNLIED